MNLRLRWLIAGDFSSDCIDDLAACPASEDGSVQTLQLQAGDIDCKGVLRDDLSDAIAREVDFQ